LFRGQVFVVEQAIAEQGLFKVFAAHEMMGLQDVRDAPIEALDPSVGLWRPGTGQAMLNGKRGAQLIELMPTAGFLVTAKQADGEFLAVVRQDLLEVNPTGPGEVFQEGPGAPGGLVFPYFQEHPAGRPVDDDKQITPSRLVRHPRQVFHVHVQEARFIRISDANEVPPSSPFLAFSESTTSRNTSREKNSGQRENCIESSGMRHARILGRLDTPDYLISLDKFDRLLGNFMRIIILLDMISNASIIINCASFEF
jgi:hypothetical protein